jgi:hypothetical protein
LKLPHGYTRSVSVVGLSDAAFRLHFAALDWCGEQRTGGRIGALHLRALPLAPTGRRLVAAVAELVAVGLWATRFQAAVDAWQIVDAEEFDAVASAELSAKRAEAGRKGGRAKKSVDVPMEIKDQARQALTRALARGEVTRGPCAVCGDPSAHGHHWDYSRPLDVVWLCHAHHEQEHTRLRKELAASKLPEPDEQRTSKLLSNEQASGSVPGRDPSSPLVLPSPDSLSGSDSSLSQASAERPESFSLVGATEAKRARRKALSHLVPEGWEPSGEHRKIAREFGADFDLELAKFRDHEFATARSDWNRAFRNWLRKDQPRRFAKPPGAIQHEAHIDHNRRPESRRLDLPERRGGVGLAFGGTKT